MPTAPLVSSIATNSPRTPTLMLQEEVPSGDTPKGNHGTWRQTQPGPGCFALSHNLARLQRPWAPLSPCLAPAGWESPLLA